MPFWLTNYSGGESLEKKISILLLFSSLFVSLPITLVNAKGPEAYVTFFTGTYGIAVTNTGGPVILEVSITVHGTSITGFTSGYEGWTIVQEDDTITWTANTNKDGLHSRQYIAFGFTLSSPPTSISWSVNTKKTTTESTDIPPYPTT